MPKKWKQAYVTPIHKSGSQNDVSNYRPISKLSIIAKLLDSLVADELFTHFRHSISEHQHGFFRGRSTVTNLIGHTERIQNCLRQGGQIDVIYTDFSKAFDKVSHDALLHKLNSHGICGSLLSWIGSYLKERTLRVQIGNALSDPVNVTSSVVQISHCGPILFAIFINDIADLLGDDYNFYADDIKIFLEINREEDHQKLQQALDRLAIFATDNGLSLNVSKCFIVSYTRRTKRFMCNNYSIGDHVLERKNEIKDLGVIFDSACTFNAHIDATCRRSKRALGFILRNSKDFKNAKTVVTLYTSHVKSILEYASPIWSPSTSTKIKQLETVQHKFLRFIAKKFFGDTNERIDYKFYERKLKLQSLELRRTLLDINFTIKSFNGKVDSYTFLNNFCLSVPRQCSRYRQVFNVSSSPTVISRLSNNFNKYLNDVDALSGKSCKKCVKCHVESKFARESLKNNA